MNILHLAHKTVRTIFRKIQNSLGISTIGVRAIVLNKENKILLVKHTYSPGWYLPGGGVKKGESVYQGIIRELKEETGVIVKSSPELYDIYLHYYAGMYDYPILFIVKDYDKVSSDSLEIAEVNWFSYAELPPDITPATKRRLDEYFEHYLSSHVW